MEDFLETLFQRQFVAEEKARDKCINIDGLKKALKSKGCVGYIGFDCTARSLHVGSLLQIMLLRWFQKCGHRPIILMGSATTRIGDPSDKTEMRPMLSDKDIEDNKASIKTIFEKFLDFSDSCDNKPIILDNADWLGGLKYLDFLRDYGTDFTVNKMLTLESVKTRLDREQPLTFLEFNYMLLQAYDFVHLSKEHNCVLQFGGSDQWGNICNGVDLGRRKLGKELYGITTDLIENSDGKKMGKTAQGAVWLNSKSIDQDLRDTLDPYRYWQFWRNTTDNDVIKFLKIYTDLDLKKIQEYESLDGEELNDAKILLADEATKLCHGDKALEEIRSIVEKENDYTTFYSKSHAESACVSEDEIKAGMMLYKLLVKVGLCKSGNEAKDIVGHGGIEMNGERVIDPYHVMRLEDFKQAWIPAGNGTAAGGHRLVLLKGKKGKNMEWAVVNLPPGTRPWQ